MGLNFLVETRSDRLDGNRINYPRRRSPTPWNTCTSQGYLHRDICPRNVMVTNEGVVKLIDFGLTIPNQPEFCKPGNRTGTPNYLAPELIRRVTTDHRVDLFALGVTAYEMFTRQLPWEKAAVAANAAQPHERAGRNPREFNPKLDDATVKFLVKSVERDPADRFQTAAEFREALQKLSKKY